MDKLIRFDVSLENIEKINPLFSKAKINVLYTGNNRNNTYFSKESVESAIPSIFNVPIIGEYLEQKDNFGSHGGKIEITDEGVNFVQTTKPYGVIPESANIYWENITESNGDINEYLVIDGAYLWTGRYSELDDLLEQAYGQSMEIEVEDGEYETLDGVKTFNVKSFVFSALCILGVDKNGEGEVEPCFESASIVAYSLDKDEFKTEFNQMISELKFSMNQSLDKGGSINVDEKLELIKKYSFTKEELEAKEINLESFSLEELEEKLKELKSSKPEFSLTAEQFKDELVSALKQEQIEDDWGSYSRFSYVDYDETTVYAFDRSDDYKLYGFSYQVSGDSISIDFESKARKKFQIVDFEGEDSPTQSFEVVPKEAIDYEVKVAEKKTSIDYEKKLEAQKEKLSALENDVNDLREFKSKRLADERNSAEQELYSQFAKELTEEEINSVKEKASEYSLDQLEEKLFTLVGKKKANFSKITKLKRTNTIKVPVEPKTDEPVYYGGLFDKYLN